MLTKIEGEFVKITMAGHEDLMLKRGDPARPPARFNRLGQDALYLSPDEEAARVAIGGYVQAGDPPRLLQRYQVTACDLLDLRLPENAALYELAKQPWQPPFKAGDAPPSWSAADEIRKRGIKGLIDPSRRRPGLWHVTLFNWNEDGAPKVMPLGAATPIHLTLDYR